MRRNSELLRSNRASRKMNSSMLAALLIFSAIILVCAAIPILRARAALTQTVLHMHGSPTDDTGTTGTGNVDVTLTTNFPALLGKAIGAGPAAHWDVTNPATIDGTTARNDTAPNWVWILDPLQGGPGPVNLGGDMAVQWWASCGLCTGSFGTQWQIRVFADGVKKFDQRVTPNRDNSNTTPDIPKLHGTTVFLHENFPAETSNTIRANNSIVLHIEPVFIDTQNSTHIFYDSTMPCPSSPPSNTAPCDSEVTMPVLGATDPLPSPTPTPGPIPPATLSVGPGPRFQNFNPPRSFIAQGTGLDAGEPSIGVNWKTNKTMYMSDLTTLRVTFNDACPSNPSATWEDKSAPNNATSLDPILFTDHGYNRLAPNVGRTFVSELTGQDSLSAFTDDDGETWIPSQGGGIPSGVDHQAIGAGPFHTPLVGTVYPNAVYYCSQDVATAFCARSDDGGATFGAGVPAWNLTACGGLHGHPKVAPDGTVYVPNKSCLGRQAVVVSEDNGINWSVRLVPNSRPAGSDPTVGIGSGGRVYFAFASANSQAAVAVSDDRGLTWPKTFDVGASLGIQSVAFSEMVAGDNDRAAAAFLGSTTAGTSQVNLQDRRFPGVYNLIVATTYDGGSTWTTTNATPNDVVQRGGIWLGGGSPVQRNLLDFNGMDIDKDGRILIGYADGCTGPACVHGSSTATGNSYTQMTAIARQTGGPRLFSGNDPTTPTTPGAPSLTVGRDGSVAHLTWSESDDGGSPITNFAVMRGTASGGEIFLANTGTATNFDDPTANPSITYFYTVTATNAQGTSCGSNEVRAQWTGDSQCSGLSVVIDPAGNQTGAPANADLDIREIRVADNVVGGKEQLVFKMKVADLSTLLPDRQWRIIFSFPTPPDNTTAFTGSYYVGMNTDSASTPSFEYGTVTTVETVPVNTSSPNKIGAADSGSVNQQTGVITIVLSADKIGGPKAGDIVGLIIGRTFAGNGNQTLRSNSAIDRTSGRAAQDPYTGASYRLAGNAPCPARLNYALSTLGGLAVASSTYPFYNFGASNAIDGDRTGVNWGGSPFSGWNDGTYGVYPDILEVDLNGSKAIDTINVFTLQNNWTTAGQPDLTTPATGEGILDFHLEMSNGASWLAIPGCSCSVTGNDKAWRQFTFPAVQMTKFRIVVTDARNGYSRIVELEAFGAGGQP